jgi:hypothetical protein
VNEIYFKLAFAKLVIDAAREYILAHIEVKPSEYVRGGKSMMNRCWIWKGSGDGRYGHAYFLGHRYKAHVLAYLAFVGTYRRHHIIDHDPCNNTSCCSPFHLQAVTQSFNIKRAYAIGRVKNPNRRAKQTGGLKITSVIIDEINEELNKEK